VAGEVPAPRRRAGAGVHADASRAPSARAQARGFGIRAAALHADRTQQQRTAAVEGFRGGQYHVLVATDVAARGLDIDGITHVVNYEVPSSARPTCTASAAPAARRATGTALTLVAPEELRALQALQRSFGRAAGMRRRHESISAVPAHRARRTPPADAPRAAGRARAVAPAVMKFKSCRWRCAPEDGEFCTHRDVLPFAGKKASSRTRGARSARSTSCAARRRSAMAPNALLTLIRYESDVPATPSLALADCVYALLETPRQLDPLPFGRSS
jgi:ATP-dependent RNA helicase RhlE